jgi:hypothetical protein
LGLASRVESRCTPGAHSRNQHAEPNAYPDTKPDAYPDTKPDAYPDTKPDAYPDTKPDAYTHANSDIYTDQHSHADTIAVQWRDDRQCLSF